MQWISGVSHSVSELNGNIVRVTDLRKSGSKALLFVYSYINTIDSTVNVLNHVYIQID